MIPLPATPPAAAAGPTSTLLLLGVVACGLLRIPTEACSPLWLITLSVPAALLWTMSLAPWPGPTLRVALVAMLQLSAIALAVQIAEPLQPPAALACSLLPPLAWTLCRRQGSDVILTLFLSFCLLLVGGMLAGVGLHWLDGAFFGLALLVLWRDASKSSQDRAGSRWRRTATGPAKLGTRIGTAALLLIVAGVAAGTAYEAMSILPGTGAGNQPGQRPTDGPSRVGLSPRFDLNGGGNPVLDANGAPILLVQSMDGDEVPGDLYLRSRTFERAGLASWLDTPPPRRSIRRRWLLRQTVPGQRSFRLIRLGMHKGEVFVPTGTTRLAADRPVEGNSDERVLVEADPFGDLVTTAEMALADGYSVDGVLDVRADARLTRLPVALRTGRFAVWGQQVRTGTGADPLDICRTVADRIRANHTYQLAEPRGPNRHAIENFLFGPEQAGFCMHFASALAIALRQAEIPARIAVGLMGGEPDTESPGDRLFRSAHAHAWVEVPIRLANGDRCWAVFDATAAGELVGGGWPASSELPGTDPRGNEQESELPEESWLTDLPESARLLPWILVLAALGLLMRLAPRRRGTRDATTDPVTQAAMQHGERLRRALNRQLGWPTQRPTLEALVRRAQGELDAGTVRLELPPLSRGVAAIQEVRFGARPLDADREAEIEAAIRAAVSAEPVERSDGG